MSATRVVFGGPPVSSPMTQRELTMRLCLSPPPPLCCFLSSYEELRSAGVPSLKPLRPCLIPKAGSQQPGEWMEPHSGIGGDGTSTKKKRVVFADSKGLSLTAVRFFSEREGGCLDLRLEQQIGQARRRWRGRAQSPGLQERQGSRFSLGFPQPSVDYLAFRDQLQRNLVRLENCSVNERSLSGTVRVKNVGFHKEVRVRITFDSWHSHRDLPCSYMHQTYGGADSDSFAFDIPLPEHPDPRERMEFCVSFCSGPHTAWDNNEGMNFRVFCTGDEQPPAPSLPPPPPPPPPRLPCKPLDKLSELEPLSSPRAAAELFFSRFQSWGRLEKVAPYW
ncbi:protein phosphatase 1 regulatory subunit 3C-B-like [Acipenser ruthenus]|uniref:protein phosphatase 1 regulatory subunit 3C-B-like n=1 Tax=Acipenser ruthenus TaxID=7906 RepID=UPI002741C24B|nr:protein phosphatase 1 regulatory subunit 3C-B-like [Acipenser ruthenus]